MKGLENMCLQASHLLPSISFFLLPHTVPYINRLLLLDSFGTDRSAAEMFKLVFWTSKVNRFPATLHFSAAIGVRRQRTSCVSLVYGQGFSGAELTFIGRTADVLVQILQPHISTLCCRISSWHLRHSAMDIYFLLCFALG